MSYRKVLVYFVIIETFKYFNDFDLKYNSTKEISQY